MRISLLALLMPLTFSVVAEAQVRKFPYEAIVEGTAVTARSGPGRKYYTASTFMRGERVLVHRHDPGGWYMIAPPRGSFSWIPAHQVTRTSPQAGVVKGNFVSVRVGSTAGEGSDVEQVRLSTGTPVQILGESVEQTMQGPVAVLKIVPPAGEYRWIQGHFVVPVDDSVRRANDHDPYSIPANARRENLPDRELVPVVRSSHAGNNVAARRELSARTQAVAKPIGPSGMGPQASRLAMRADAPVVLIPPPRIEAPRPYAMNAAGPRLGQPTGPLGAGSATHVSMNQNPAAPSPNAVTQPHPFAVGSNPEGVGTEKIQDLRTALRQDIRGWQFEQIQADYQNFIPHVAGLPQLDGQLRARFAAVARYRQRKAEYDAFVQLTARTELRDRQLQQLQYNQVPNGGGRLGTPGRPAVMAMPQTMGAGPANSLAAQPPYAPNMSAPNLAQPPSAAGHPLLARAPQPSLAPFGRPNVSPLPTDSRNPNVSGVQVGAMEGTVPAGSPSEPETITAPDGQQYRRVSGVQSPQGGPLYELVNNQPRSAVNPPGVPVIEAPQNLPTGSASGPNPQFARPGTGTAGPSEIVSSPATAPPVGMVPDESFGANPGEGKARPASPGPMLLAPGTQSPAFGRMNGGIHPASGAAQSAPAIPGESPAAPPQAGAPGLLPDVDAAPVPQKFDGAGVIQKTAAIVPGAPRHVLVAPGGRVLAFLLGDDETSFDPFVGQSMGVVGQRTRHPNLRLDVIHVDSLTEVELAK